MMWIAGLDDNGAHPPLVGCLAPRVLYVLVVSLGVSALENSAWFCWLRNHVEIGFASPLGPLSFGRCKLQSSNRTHSS
jgi:hypothetical protein